MTPWKSYCRPPHPQPNLSRRSHSRGVKLLMFLFHLPTIPFLCQSLCLCVLPRYRYRDIGKLPTCSFSCQCLSACRFRLSSVASPRSERPNAIASIPQEREQVLIDYRVTGYPRIRVLRFKHSCRGNEDIHSTRDEGGLIFSGLGACTRLSTTTDDGLSFVGPSACGRPCRFPLSFFAS